MAVERISLPHLQMASFIVSSHSGDSNRALVLFSCKDTNPIIGMHPRDHLKPLALKSSVYKLHNIGG